MKKPWCRHIIIRHDMDWPKKPVYRIYTYTMNEKVPRGWKLCPLCGTPRPTPSRSKT